MTDTQIAEAAAAPPQEEGRDWRPSRRPEHQIAEGQGRIVEQLDPKGVVGQLRDYFKRPFVRLVIGLGIFIAAALIYDSTLNFGSWTEKAAAPKAANHRGLKPVPLTPD